MEYHNEPAERRDEVFRWFLSQSTMYAQIWGLRWLIGQGPGNHIWVEERFKAAGDVLNGLYLVPVESLVLPSVGHMLMEIDLIMRLVAIR